MLRVPAPATSERKDRGVDADANGERQHGNGGIPTFLDEQAESESKVLEHRVL